MTTEELKEAVEIQNKISNLDKEIQMISKIVDDRDWRFSDFNTQVTIPKGIRDTVKLLVITQMNNDLEELKNKFKEI